MSVYFSVSVSISQYMLVYLSIFLSISQHSPAYPICSKLFPQEEVAQSKALDQIYKKKLPMNVKDTTMDVLEDEDWVVTGVPSAGV